MVRVKLVKEKYYEDGNVVYKEGGAFCDKEYDAFFINRKNDREMNEYALDMGDGIYFVDECQVEVISAEPIVEVIADGQVQKVLNGKPRILMVEDGSVDVDNLEEWCEENNIKLIVYRSGANPPAWLD